MMKKLFLIALLLSFSVASVEAASVEAASASAPVVVGTQAQLDKLNAENALLTIQLKNVELKRKIHDDGVSSTLTIPRLPGGSKSSEYMSMSDAKVVLVSGTPGHAIATLEINGAMIKVVQGKVISGLGIVKSISIEEVIIRTRHGEYTLPFVAENVSASTGTDLNGSSLPALPPLPMGVR